MQRILTPRENQNKVKSVVKTYAVSTILTKAVLGWLKKAIMILSTLGD